jgi:hypothetical protein
MPPGAEETKEERRKTRGDNALGTAFADSNGEVFQ